MMAAKLAICKGTTRFSPSPIEMDCNWRISSSYFDRPYHSIHIGNHSTFLVRQVDSHGCTKSKLATCARHFFQPDSRIFISVLRVTLVDHPS